MDCKRFIELLPQIAHVDLENPTIGQETYDDFYGHIESCSDCRKAFDAFLTIDGTFRERAKEIFCDEISPELVVKAVIILIEKAKAFQEAGDYHESIKCLEEALKLKPDDYESTVVLGYMHFLQKDYHRSEQHFEKAFWAEWADDFRPPFYLGLIAVEKENYHDAQFYLHRAHLRDLTNPYIASHLVYVSLELKDIIHALYFYEMAIQLSMKFPDRVDEQFAEQLWELNDSLKSGLKEKSIQLDLKKEALRKDRLKSLLEFKDFSREILDNLRNTITELTLHAEGKLIYHPSFKRTETKMSEKSASGKP